MLFYKTTAMPILGNLIKSAIDFRRKISWQHEDPAALQRAELIRLLEKARSTAFGIYHGFDRMLKEKDPVAAFRARTPIFDYDRLHERWWAQQQREPDITWPGKPDYFALSSGTTGSESKRIPVTKDMLASIRSVSLDQVKSLANFDLPPEFFEKDLLMLGSSADLEARDGHLEGEISGINASEVPAWFRGFYKPGMDIARIADWDERLAEIVRCAPDWDVSGMAGIPSWIQLMLETVVAEYDLDNIHQLWPSLSVYASGGVAFEPYRESFEALLDHPIFIMDTYLASEGFFAYNARPDTMAMRLALEHGVFYEFVPFDKRGFDPQGNLLSDPLVLTIGEVEPEQDYALLISTCAGAWRYLIGDTIRFIDTSRSEILITGRTKYFLNVVGSQLSEEKMNRAITELGEAMGAPIREFAVAALPDGEGHYFHQWAVGAEGGFEEEAAAAWLDRRLRELNKNYGVARDKALTGVRLRRLHPDDFYAWIEQEKKKGGQVKIPKVMSEEQMRDFLTFVNADAG